MIINYFYKLWNDYAYLPQAAKLKYFFNSYYIIGRDKPLILDTQHNDVGKFKRKEVRKKKAQQPALSIIQSNHSILA